MVSDKQLKANIKNSAKGGVKTAEGKTVSRFNALTHGILRNSLTDYEDDFYKNILIDLHEEFNPQGVTEQILLERIAICYLKLFRVQKAETEYLKAHFNPRIIKSSMDIGEMPYSVIKKGYSPRLKTENIEVLSSTFSRYETTIENRLFRALHELERTQRARNGERMNSPRVVDVNQMGSFGERSNLDE